MFDKPPGDTLELFRAGSLPQTLEHAEKRALGGMHILERNRTQLTLTRRNNATDATLTERGSRTDDTQKLGRCDASGLGRGGLRPTHETQHLSW